MCTDSTEIALLGEEARAIMKKVDIGGIDVAYRDEGRVDGTPIVLSHSLFFDSSMFEELAARYVARGFRVVAYDHPGQGRSGDATTDQLAVDALTSVAAGLINRLGLGPVHFVGNSLGGMVAVRLVARRPELLRSAVALGSSARSEQKVVEYAPLATHLTAHGASERADIISTIMFGDDTLAENGEIVRRWRDHITALPPRIGPAVKGVIYRGDMDNELRLERATGSRVVPVLAIAGEQDHAYEPAIAADHMAAATAGRSVVLPGCGHSVALEKPNEVFEETIEFFAETTEPGAV
ncbi:alpha/beta fold hydrolase [Nocardia wallacei]|uniref:alpha/beta fold hydrolase n=1 Tax=Nocardia wallacei TaxID=480035 RepID=UPI002454C216|nr:alpha/beta hydrolase [Nocardia wallacei]